MITIVVIKMNCSESAWRDEMRWDISTVISSVEWLSAIKCRRLVIFHFFFFYRANLLFSSFYYNNPRKLRPVNAKISPISSIKSLLDDHHHHLFNKGSNNTDNGDYWPILLLLTQAISLLKEVGDWLSGQRSSTETNWNTYRLILHTWWWVRSSCTIISHWVTKRRITIRVI